MTSITLRSRLLAGAAAVALLAAAPAAAADLPEALAVSRPAVDDFNGKIEGFGGWLNGTDGRSDSFKGGAVASFTSPLGERFGFQVDGLLGTTNNRLAYGGAGHLFTRNPDSYLIGAYASAIGFENTGGAWSGKIGGEAEFYLGQFTLSGTLGVERDYDGNSRFQFSKKTSFFDYVDLSYYVTDDFKASLGHRYIGRIHSAALTGEYQLPIQGANVALFGEGRIGEDHYRSAVGGVRFYFGAGDKTLKARQRESDPPTYLRDDLGILTGANRTTNGPVKEPPVCNCGDPCSYQ